MPKLKLGTIFPTDEDDRKICDAIAQDPDAVLLEGSDVKLVPFGQLKATRKRGRPVVETPKVAVNVRYSAEVIEVFKATGSGWQTRMDAALKDWLRQHNPSDVKI